MAELTNSERLQPSLLDRLRDDEPQNSKESRDQRVMSLHQIRESVQRDLASILNAGCLSMAVDLDDYPYVQHSVLNYGIPDLSGTTVHGVEAAPLEKLLKQAIIDFEPRILANSLKITVTTDPDEMHQTAMVFEIEGKLWSQPMPLRLLWNTEIDLETGEVIVTESNG
jgi:type VI secretion system protein ImpF